MAQGTIELLERLQIDPEFRDKIPPLTAEEYRQLKDNILDAGEVYEPINVWGMVVVDGHHRLKVIREHPEVKWQTRSMDFADRWAAIEWMCRNQLGRRNLTDEQRTYTIGIMYKARKKSVGNTTGKRNEDGTFQCAQNGPIGNRPTRVSEQVAADVGVGKETVKRAEKFAQGVDAIRQIDGEAADKVLAGKSKLTKTEIAGIAKMEPERQMEAAQAIIEDKPLDKPEKPQNAPRREPKGDELTEADRERRKRIDAIVADMYDPTTNPEYTVDFLIDDIKFNAGVYVELLESTLNERRHLLTEENRHRVIETINEYVLDRLMRVRDTI